MVWAQAVKWMLKGGRIKRKSWLKNDYLYTDECGVIKDDGGNPFYDRLHTGGAWIKSKES